MLSKKEKSEVGIVDEFSRIMPFSFCQIWEFIGELGKSRFVGVAKISKG